VLHRRPESTPGEGGVFRCRQLLDNVSSRLSNTVSLKMEMWSLQLFPSASKGRQFLYFSLCTSFLTCPSHAAHVLNFLTTSLTQREVEDTSIHAQSRSHKHGGGITTDFTTAIGVTVGTVVVGTTLVCALAHCWRQILDGDWCRCGRRRRSEKRRYLKKYTEEAWFCGPDRGGGLPMPLIAPSPDPEQGLDLGLEGPERTLRCFLNYEIRATPSPTFSPAPAPMLVKAPCGRRLDVPRRKELAAIPPARAQQPDTRPPPKTKTKEKEKTKKSGKRIAKAAPTTLPSWQDSEGIVRPPSITTHHQDQPPGFNPHRT